jgi:hypothetical protein
MRNIEQIITFIPNQQRSSFTNFRNLLIMGINEIIENQNKSINNKNEKINKIKIDSLKSRDELNQFIKNNGFETFGKSIIKKQIIK